MEKLIYVLWKPEQVAIENFRGTLLGRTARRLDEHGVRGLAVTLADENAVVGLRIAQRDPTGFVSLWLDSALIRAPIEAELAAITTRLAGYLVLESVPLLNPHPLPTSGERIPGLYTVAFLEKPDALTSEEWLERWQGEHTQVAIETQSTFLYVQNVNVRALTKDAPPWTAIVEEAFPAEAATDPMVFYRADSPEMLAAHQRRMMQSCERFIDFARFETHPMSAYVVKALALGPPP